MPKNFCIMQIWAEPGKSALPICNYSQILYQFLTFTQNLKRSPDVVMPVLLSVSKYLFYLFHRSAGHLSYLFQWIPGFLDTLKN